MLAKQTILIIGTGHSGKAIATRLASGNFHLLLCDKEYTKAAALVMELQDIELACDVEAMQCSFESAWEADIIILAMHFQEQKEVAEIIKDVVNQKILVSIADPGPEIISGLSSAGSQHEALQALLPNTKIVNIFNDDPGIHQLDFDKINTGILMGGNDDQAVEIVSGILASVGINSFRYEHLSTNTSLSKQF